MGKTEDFTFTGHNADLTFRARELRREMTPQERRLWFDYLRYYPIKFYRQRTIDRCIADFYCSRAKLAVEVDGSQHLTPEGLAYDKERTDILNAYGISVLRFSNTQIDRSFNSVCMEIDRVVRGRISQNDLPP